MKGIYADYADKLKIKPVIIDIDIYDDYAEIEKKPPVMSEIMERDVNKVLAEPYRKFMEMSEGIITSGENYIVSTKCKYPGALNSLSILVYNFDENAGRNLRKIMNKEDLLRIVRNYENEIEFLVRCTGLSGNFRIIRYRLEREHLLAKISGETNTKTKRSVRDNLINKLSSEAKVSTGNYISSDALSVRTIFDGIGAELILIDRV